MPNYKIKPPRWSWGSLHQLSMNAKRQFDVMGLPHPVGYWPLIAGAGGTGFDISGNSVHGTLQNNAAWTHNGLIFPTDNSTDRLDLGSTTSSDPLSGVPSGKITAVAKVGRTSTLNNAYPRIIDKSSLGNMTNGWGLYWREPSGYNEDAYVFVVDALAGQIATSSLGAANVTEIVLATVEANSFGKIYVDGDDQTDTGGSYDKDFSFSSTTTNAAIGNWNHDTDRQWENPIHFVICFDDTFDAAQVEKITDQPYRPLYPAAAKIYSFPAVAPGISIPVVMHHRRMAAA